MAIFRSLIYWSFVKVYTNDSTNQIRKKKFLLSNFSVIKPSLSPLSFWTKFMQLHSSTHFIRVLDLSAFLYRISTYLDLESQPSQLAQKNRIYFLFSLVSNSFCCLTGLFLNTDNPNFTSSLLKYSSYIRQHQG